MLSFVGPLLGHILTTVVQLYVSKEHPQNLCLAGGVFGNEKLNQRLRELDGVKTSTYFPLWVMMVYL